MLPFLKPKSQASLIVSKRKPDVEEYSSTEESRSIEACMNHFLEGINSKDSAKMAEALVKAHGIMHEHMDQEIEPMEQEE